MAYTKYSLTPADNNAAPPNGAPEGMLPSAVNDTMRDMMSQIRDVGDGIRGGTYTMTAPVITGGSITGVALSGNTFTNPVITGGSINNTTVGATTRSTGAFTTLASNGATTFTAGTASTSTTTGTAVITGGLGVSGRINAANFDGIVGANTAAAGNFTTLGATGVATFSAGTVSAPSITTTGDTNTGMFFPAADTIAFTEGGVEAMRISSAGNLGIATISPDTKLQVITASSGDGIEVATASGASRRRVLISADGTAGYIDSYNFAGSTGTILSLNSNGGNVGIGTSSPAGKLGVTSSSTDSRIYIQNSSTGGTNADGFMLGVISSDAYVYQYENAPLLFGTNGTERMRITSAGNVGIGTSSPNNKLIVNGGMGAIGEAGAGLTTGILIDQTASTLCRILCYSATSSSLAFYTGTSSAASERMRLDSAGNLGIGTTSPSSKLDVSGLAKANAFGMNATGGSPATGMAAPASDTLALYTNTIERMRIDSSGNLLVGITSARANAGDVQVSKGISFPATQSAQSDANTLDDYEEGTWTPGISFGGATTGITYADRSGLYVKIGRQVTVTCLFNLSNKGSATGQARITGLPFTVANNNGASSCGSMRYFNGAFLFSPPTVDINATTLETLLSNTDFTNTSQVILTCTYFV